MQAHEDGKVIEFAVTCWQNWAQMGADDPIWNWEYFDYRIKEENELFIAIWKSGKYDVIKYHPLTMIRDTRRMEIGFKAVECNSERYTALVHNKKPRMACGSIYLQCNHDVYKYVTSDLITGKYFELEILIDNREKENKIKDTLQDILNRMNDLIDELNK